MCGIRLETPPAKPASVALPDREGQQVKASSRASILGLESEPAARRPSAPRPAITGPSFLGLGTEPDPAGTDYLLEEDEEPRGHRGLWVTLGLLVVVALAGLHFQAELRVRAGQLYAAVLERVNPKPPAPVVPAAGPALPPAAAPASPASAAANDALPGAGVTPDVGPQSAGAQNPPPKPDDDRVPAAGESAPKAGAESREDASPGKNTGQVAKFAHASRQNPADAVTPETNQLLQLAQKYIRGQGVHRDCPTGLAYLREATKHPNPEAASQMGALYATGTCVSLDRVAAYRWFTSALQMAPNNPWLARERDELYGQMSGAERRQADRQ